MKIFAVYNNYNTVAGNNALPATFSYQGVGTPVVYTVPDTAQLKDDRPFFIPDFASPCTFQASLLVRISRLGRSISPRFAHRYYDAATVGVAFTAQRLWEESCREGLPWDTSKGFDSAAVTGRFIPLDGRHPDSLAFELHENGRCVQQGPHTAPRWSVDELIAHISRFYLLRQGDLLYTGFPCPPGTARQDSHLTALMDGKKVLSFNIK